MRASSGASGYRGDHRHRLVKAQIRIAAGSTPGHRAGDTDFARARHRMPHQRRASETFAPSPGRNTGLKPAGRIRRPGGHRGVHGRGDSAYYDSLVAKLIVHGSDRAEAIARMRRALEMFVVEGIHTSIPLHQRILMHEDFIAGALDTGFLARTKLAGGK